MTFLLSLFRTPEAQGDPYQWASVLLAHALIGLALTAVLPLGLAVAVYTSWEAAQWGFYKADPWDCLLDWCAYALGSAVAVALMAGAGPLGAIVALSLVLAAGVRKRQ